MPNKIRFGIIGCSRIAEGSTIPAIVNSKFSELKIIGSRSKEKAEKFAKKFNCKEFGSYEDVLENKDVDAVYISLPVGLHEEWTVKAAQAGKHILCEKSLTTSYRSAYKMVESCKKNNVRLMEGLMFRFHPQHKKVLEFVRNGSLGKIFLFNGQYGLPPVPHDDIRQNKNLGGGVLNDAGCYPICASRIVFGEPSSVFCNLVINKDTKVDEKANLCLKYDDSRFAQITVGYDLYYQSTYSVWGSQGMLKLTRSYNIPADMNAMLILHSSKDGREISVGAYNHYVLMIDSFCHEITGNNQREFNFEEDLLKQAKIMEAARISDREKCFVDIEEIEKK